VKAEKNQRVHGISFEKAAEVFDDPNHVVGDNYFIESDGEQRYQVIGMTRRLLGKVAERAVWLQSGLRQVTEHGSHGGP
jgi:uncharacterized DUF497 family protein